MSSVPGIWCLGGGAALSEPFGVTRNITRSVTGTLPHSV